MNGYGNEDAPLRCHPGILGRKCRINGGVPGMVSGILERVTGGLELEVIWWDGNTRRCEWLAAAEVTFDPADDEAKKFGFDHA